MVSRPDSSNPVNRLSAVTASISRGGPAVAPLAVAGPPRDSTSAITVANRFEMLILQPTTLCNLDCSYCYLPDRKVRRLMSVRVAERVAESVREQAETVDVGTGVDAVWHAGEPLATPTDHFRRLLLPFEPLRADGLIRHQVQTNATLISDAWCELLAAYDFRVGISIDGPATANQQRVNWAGKPSFEQVIDGVGVLKRNGIDFHTICVVTPETIGRGRELVEFFTGLGCQSVGFNIEEHEGVDTGRPMIGIEEATVFWAEILRAAPSYGLFVRELRELASYLRARRTDSGTRLEPIPTIAYNGEVVLLSPELAGIADPAYDNFRAGNVLTCSIPDMVHAAGRLRYVREFTRGLAECRSSCGFWDYCRGAQAGNRYFEHGTFATTETSYCRTTKQALILAAAHQAGGHATQKGTNT